MPKLCQTHSKSLFSLNPLPSPSVYPTKSEKEPSKWAASSIPDSRRFAFGPLPATRSPLPAHTPLLRRTADIMKEGSLLRVRIRDLQSSEVGFTQSTTSPVGTHVSPSGVQRYRPEFRQILPSGGTSHHQTRGQKATERKTQCPQKDVKILYSSLC